jgi:hypothetical protein
LRLGGVPRFELNVPIVHAGRVIAVADVLWRELRAVLEIDGREYHLSEAQWKATMARHNRLTAAGYAVTHYPPSAMRDGGLAWVAEVDDRLRARAREPGRPFPSCDLGLVAGQRPQVQDHAALDGRRWRVRNAIARG